MNSASIDFSDPTSEALPVVSMAAWTNGDDAARAAIVKTIGDALCDIGFFAVTDHGIDRAVIDRAYAVAEAFFELPSAVKAQYAIAGGRGQRGFTAFGMEHAKGNDAPDLKEFWHVGREFHPDHAAYRSLNPNVWPTEITAFRDAMLALYDALGKLAGELLVATSLYLQESPAFLSQLAFEGDTILRLIHYPPVASDAHPSAIRAAAHEDINLLTILCEATSGGLELLQHDGRWRAIHAQHGHLIVDAGDMLQHVSNGLLKSTTHRVVNPNNSRDRRFSMPYFVHPRPDADLTPRPGAIARTGGEARYPAMSGGQFLQQRLAEIGLGTV